MTAYAEMTTTERMEQERTVRDEIQKIINHSSPEAAHAALVVNAMTECSKYPQYNNYFENYRVVRVRKRVKTKGGNAFEKGDLAIAAKYPNRPDLEEGYGGPVYSVWSVRNGIDTVVAEADLELV